MHAAADLFLDTFPCNAHTTANDALFELLAMVDALRILRPGLRQTDLSAEFLRRVFELGASANGIDPIWQVMARHKDIQFASRADSHILRQKQLHRLRHVIRELAQELPASKRGDAHCKDLAAWGCSTTMHVAHLVAPRLEDEDSTKDIDFSPVGVRARREAGYADTMRMIERSPWDAPTDPIEGVIEHH